MIFSLFLFSEFVLCLRQSLPQLIEDGTQEYQTKTKHEEYVNGQDSVTLEHFIYSEINTTLLGGAVKVDKTNITIKDCKFVSCIGKNGGALYLNFDGSNIFDCLVQNCIFNECTATSRGGAVYINVPQVNKKITIDGCQFTENIATNEGGAIYAIARDLLTIQGCTFTNNQGKIGSSLWCEVGWGSGSDQDDRFKLYDNSFAFTPTQNSSNVYIINKEKTGGAVKPPTVIIGRCMFNTTTEVTEEITYLHLDIEETLSGYTNIIYDECNCFKQGSNTVKVPSKFETSISVNCQSLDVCQQNFLPNPDLPIGTDNRIPSNHTFTEINIENTTFSYLVDTVKSGGGAICITGNGKVNITLTKCDFLKCSSNNGGAIFIELATTPTAYIGKVIDSKFRYCEATKNGGAALVKINNPKIHSFEFENCKFEFNKAASGGAIYAVVRDLFTVTGCTFNINEASAQGSSIYLQIGWNAKADADNTFIVEDNVFTFAPDEKNKINVYFTTAKSANNDSNAILHLGGNKFVAVSTVDGFMHLQMDQNSPYQSVIYTKCNCVQQGIETVSFSSSVYPVTNFSFNCNSACKPGDPIEDPNATPLPPTPDDDGYTSSDRISVSSDENALKLIKTKFTNIESTETGGAVSIYTTNFTIDDCKFITCKSNVKLSGENFGGGAIFVSFTGIKSFYDGSIKNCNFENCETTSQGGAVNIKINQPKRHSVVVDGCKFNNNKAANFGGAIYSIARDLFTIQNCEFTNNEALNGSSLWCQIGWNAGKNENNDQFVLNNNNFTFTPSETNAINVYIENSKVNSSNVPLNAVLLIGSCKFSSSQNDANNFKHLSIVPQGDGFQSITFTDCVCIGGGEDTVSIPEAWSSESKFSFNCNSLDSCLNDVDNSDGYNEHGRIEDEPRTEPINLYNYSFKGLNNEENGGAVTINKEKTSITLNHCKFSSCQGAMGGAVYIMYSGNNTYACSITDTIFVNNQATSNGGAFYCQITQSGKQSVTLSHCIFRSNKAGTNGGAVYAMTRDKFTLEHCIFEDNVSPSKGKGSSLWLRIGWNDKYNVNKAIVHNNSFTFSPIDAKSINVHIESYPLLDGVTPNANLDFGLNKFSSKNSGITGFKQLSFDASSQFDSINFDGCNCVQNGPETVSLPYSYGTNAFNFNCQNADICTTPKPTPLPTPDSDGYTPSERIIISEGAPIRLVKSKFTNIVATQTGGAVSLTKVSFSITDCKFASCISNVTLNGNNYGGGSIYISYTGKDDNYTGSIVSCTFSNCETTSQGGALNIQITQPKRHSVIIEGCTFTNNKAANYGGAIYSIARDLLSIQHCTFTNNEALNGSSIWCQVGWNSGSDDNDQFVLYNNKFTFIPSDTNSVNVYIQSNTLNENIAPNANAFIGLCSFEGQNINGEIHKNLIISENGAFQSIDFNDCNCIQGEQNTVTIPAIVTNNNNLKFNCINMDKCTASDSEKPPETDECKSFPAHQEIFGKSLSLEKSCFYNLRSTTREGGAARIINSNVELENCRFINCSSSKSGGALYVDFSIDKCELEIENCLFENCQSNNQGGAFYFSNVYASESSIKNCRFTNNNAASHGGALYYSPCSNSKLLNCLFVNNSCTANQQTHGFAVYVLIQNINTKRVSGKLRLKDEDDNTVVIDGNRIRSEPVDDTQQMYVDVKKTGSVKIGSNSFSFNGVNVTTAKSKYIQVAADEGAKVATTGNICVDHDGTKSGLISGIDSSNVDYNCHKADSEFDNEPNDGNGGNNKNKSKTGMIVGIVVAVVVVIVIIVVVVILVKKKSNKYVSDLNEDGIADNQTGDTNENI